MPLPPTAQRNYRFFLAFVFTTSVLDGWVHGWCWARLAWICHHDPSHPSLAGAIAQEPAAIALVAYTLLALACAPPETLTQTLDPRSATMVSGVVPCALETLILGGVRRWTGCKPQPPPYRALCTSQCSWCSAPWNPERPETLEP